MLSSSLQNPASDIWGRRWSWEANTICLKLSCSPWESLSSKFHRCKQLPWRRRKKQILLRQYIVFLRFCYEQWWSLFIPDVLLEIFRVIIGSKTLVYSLHNVKDFRNKAKKRKAYTSVSGRVRSYQTKANDSYELQCFLPLCEEILTVHVTEMLKATTRDSTKELKRTKQSVWSCQNPLYSSHCVSKLGDNIITETETLELETYHTNSSYLQWRRVYFLKDRLSFLQTNQESWCA